MPTVLKTTRHPGYTDFKISATERKLKRKEERDESHCRADRAGNARDLHRKTDFSVLIEPYQDQEDFFKAVPRAAFGYAVIALPGVAGLNAVEHLRSLCPACRIIWCSDLDFSLHAFRLRVDYFLLEPVTEESFRQGLCVWLEYKAPTAEFQPYYGKQDKEVYHP